MTASTPRSASPLAGWRARAWAWVFFVALLKGLVPPMALASMAMAGNPAAVLCAPALSVGVDASAEQAAGHMAGHCVCAAAAEVALPARATDFGVVPPIAIAAAIAAPTPVVAVIRYWPPSRGPPARIA